ncbi:unnamed protein product, partial [Meganyctiphanes norvegica]
TPHGIRAVWDQTQTREQCKDNHPSCPMWGSHGECYRNPNYMVPNCAYTCNTCLVGLNNVKDDVTDNDMPTACMTGTIENVQGECDIVTRENSDTVREGIIREADAVATRTVANVDLSAGNATDTAQGALAGKELLTTVADSVATSAREYAMGCRDLSSGCPQAMEQGSCISNASFYLVHCPVSCNSCLPKDESECVNKEGVDNDSCELSAALGLCEVNYAYNLRFCAGSCKTTQSLRNRCVKTRDLSTCENKKTLRNPDFDCGVPLNRRKRLAQFIPHTQSREAKRLKDSRSGNRKKNNKRKIKIKNKNKNVSEERIRNTNIWGRQSNLNENTSVEDPSARQAVCCDIVLLGRQV